MEPCGGSDGNEWCERSMFQARARPSDPAMTNSWKCGWCCSPLWLNCLGSRCAPSIWRATSPGTSPGTGFACSEFLNPGGKNRGHLKLWLGSAALSGRVYFAFLRTSVTRKVDRAQQFQGRCWAATRHCNCSFRTPPCPALTWRCQKQCSSATCHLVLIWAN